MYKMMDYLDSIQSQIEFWGQIVFWSAMVVMGVMCLPKKKKKDKWSETARLNLAEGIRKHG